MHEGIHISVEEFQVIEDLWSQITLNDVETEKVKLLHDELERVRCLTSLSSAVNLPDRRK